MKKQITLITKQSIQCLILPLCLIFLAPIDINEFLELSVEPNHSTIQFSVPIAGGITRVTGKFTDFTIDIDYVEEDMTKSKIRSTIQAASINTGISGRDDHLRSLDFFDVEQYPEITFRSDTILKDKEGYVAFGDFQMHGIIQRIKLPFKITGRSGDHTIGFTSRLRLNRIQFGIGNEFKHTSIENFIADEIDIEIDFWTKKRKK